MHRIMTRNCLKRERRVNLDVKLGKRELNVAYITHRRPGMKAERSAMKGVLLSSHSVNKRPCPHNVICDGSRCQGSEEADVG